MCSTIVIVLHSLAIYNTCFIAKVTLYSEKENCFYPKCLKLEVFFMDDGEGRGIPHYVYFSIYVAIFCYCHNININSVILYPCVPSPFQTFCGPYTMFHLCYMARKLLPAIVRLCDNGDECIPQGKVCIPVPPTPECQIMASV